VRLSILDASVSVLLSRGLNGWSVDRVSQQAGCAKGLVNYHFGSKASLLASSAESIAERREQRRTEALSSAHGADAVDALWSTVVDDARSGTFAAWIELAALRASARSGWDPVAPAGRLRSELAKALEVQLDDLPDGLTLTALLDGMSLALLEGAPESNVQTAYQMAWPGLLG
jgi:AcrR family transcriptional regulator